MAPLFSYVGNFGRVSEHVKVSLNPLDTIKVVWCGFCLSTIYGASPLGFSLPTA